MKISQKKIKGFLKDNEQKRLTGDILEFDFGVVKIHMPNDVIKEFQLAVFTAAYSNFRWARLFPKQNTACFL